MAQDLSHLDRKYFLDGYRYNCPFCNRGSVSYEIDARRGFSWSSDKPAWLYLVRCHEKNCQKVSLHLSYFDFQGKQYYSAFAIRPTNLPIDVEFDETELDKYFFFHQPTSFFTIDSRIDRELRELISESENCLKMNFLVGASGCLRKAIYQLLEKEQTWIQRPNGRIDYRESIMALKSKFPRVPSEYFDALSSIQQMASDQVHEGSWKAWNSARLRALLELTKNVLHEMYVVPKEQEGRAAIAATMLSELKGDKKSSRQKPNADQGRSKDENTSPAQKPPGERQT